MLKRVQLLKMPLPVGSAVFLGQDWQTQGDWLGRYGRQFAILWAAGAPLDHNIISDPTYNLQLQIGPQHPPGDSIRRYARGYSTDNPRSLYDPIPGVRRQAEADDHGESVPFSAGGPGLWMTVVVPEGVHQLSLYFLNPDGHEGDNRFRDYRVNVKPFRETLKDAEIAPTLAQTRVHDFWGGVYERFVVRGPSKYSIKIDKNNSLNTLISGVFLDRLTGPVGRRDCVAWMGGTRFYPPDPDAPVPPDPHLLEKLLADDGKPAPVPVLSPAARSNRTVISAARALWLALDGTWDKKEAIPLQEAYRMAAYRAIVKAADSNRCVRDYGRDLFCQSSGGSCKI